MKKITRRFIECLTLLLLMTCTIHAAFTQQVEVQGELKVTQMTANDAEENLVIKNTDGTLGTRSVSSLLIPTPPIDTTRNLATDFELAKHLCDCPNLPPFMIKKLLESGYTETDLVESGISSQDVINAQRCGQLIDSRDNRSYKTVTIGNQTWMAENLNFGTQVLGVNDQLDNSIIEKYCYEDNPSNCDVYGGLYQWNEMMQYSIALVTQGVCPTGWHLPTDLEWKILERELGMSVSQSNNNGDRGTNQGSQLSGNETLWSNGLLDQNGAFGGSGFNALPGGVRGLSGDYSNQSTFNFMWTSTDTTIGPYLRRFTSIKPKVSRAILQKDYGFSVRCVQD